jgi:hypothetical protein
VLEEPLVLDPLELLELLELLEPLELPELLEPPEERWVEDPEPDEPELEGATLLPLLFFEPASRLGVLEGVLVRGGGLYVLSGCVPLCGAAAGCLLGSPPLTVSAAG